jgi:hypothetical protein
MLKINSQCGKMNNFGDVVKTEPTSAAMTIKIKLIQALIQMDRPQNWNSSHIINLIREIIAIEKYNSKSPSSIVKYERKWPDIENKINEMNLI